MKMPLWLLTWISLKIFNLFIQKGDKLCSKLLFLFQKVLQYFSERKSKKVRKKYFVLSAHVRKTMPILPSTQSINSKGLRPCLSSSSKSLSTHRNKGRSASWLLLWWPEIFFEIVEFLSKRSKFLDESFKISTIVESLVTLRPWTPSLDGDKFATQLQTASIHFIKCWW